jgi:sugar phosphate isomerase/epimerase
MMSRGPCTFKKPDLERMLKAAKAAGYEGVRVEIDIGEGRKMVLIAGKGDAPPETKEIVL